MRNYNRKFIRDEDDMVVTVDEWLNDCKDKGFSNWDGSGYWIKDGYVCDTDEVFSSEPEDATHVVWYNK